MSFKRFNTKDEWHAIRSKGIGGSDIASVMGLNKYRGAIDVFREKTEPAQEEVMNEAIHFGVLLEDVVAKEFASRTGMKVQRVNATFIDGIRLANIDRAVINPDIAGRVRPLDEKDENGRHMTTDVILECKTAGARSAWRWGKSQEDEIKAGNVTSTADVPMEYLAQVMWYLGITGCQTAYIAVLIGGQDFRIYKVDRDDELIASMYAIADSFWLNHVDTGNCPAPVTAEEAQKVWRRDDGESIEASSDMSEIFGELVNLKAQAKELSDQIDMKEAMLKLFIGKHQNLTLAGNRIASWKTHSSNRLDTKRLKEELPAVYAQYTKASSSRTFRIHA